MNPKGPVRVVVPAYRAMGTIRQATEAVLAAGRGLALDVVVVDDGANPGLSRLLADLPVTIRGTGGSGSAAVARNTGCAGFTEGVIAFVDADVILQPDALRILLEPIWAGRAQAAVGNYSKEVASLPFASRFKQLYISAIYDKRSGELRNDFWTAVGAVDAGVFHALGGFDVHYSGACGEDSDLGVRLSAAGHRIEGAPNARGQHRHPLTIKGLILNDWRKGKVALQIREQSGGALSENKHATPRSVASVVAATLVLLAAPLLAVGQPIPPWSAVALYLAARVDLVWAFRSQGPWFCLRALGLLWLLDLVRVTCVVARVIEPYGLVEAPRHA